jgi:two-component system, NtrC family, response regulator AtoC
MQNGCSVAAVEPRPDVPPPMVVGEDDLAPDDLGAKGGAMRQENVARARILIVEDDDEIRSAAQDALEELGYDAYTEASADRALALIHRHVPAAVVADVRMPGMDGIEFCKRLTGDWPQVPVVLMTAFGDVDMAVDALRAGAFDFITKPISFEHLASVLNRAVTQRPLVPAMVRLEDPDVPEGSYDGLVGSSEALRAVMERIARVAPTQATVLITGESGTGKELVARAVHRGSPRRDGPFVALSCAAMPHDLLEAELFGYRRGAFTGAAQSRDGLFQRADGGTLFLDEIGDMPLSLQPKLLRALEERRVRPLGSPQEVPLDVRIVAATNRDLEAAVRLGHFREDLLFRLNVHHIQVPPLRERGDDVMELARHFLARSASAIRTEPGAPPPAAPQLTPEAEQLLRAHHWPGNVRELENSLSAAIALAVSGRIGVHELPARLKAQAARGSTPPPVEPASLEEVERRHIEIVLRATGWNKALAARKLGIDRATLYRKLMRLGLTEPQR